MTEKLTIIQPHGSYESSCGYCNDVHSSNGKNSFSFDSKRIRVQEYENLMLCGWRRCGTLFYDSSNTTTCCPAYTIRLKASEFRMSKAHRQVIRRFDRYLQSGDIHEHSTLSSLQPHNFTLELHPSAYTEEKFELYKKYQSSIHGDDPKSIKPSGFSRFLVDSPLISEIDPKTSVNLGTFHHEYRLDGKLIAVGVLDILPTGISSVYFFYDADYRDLTLGKLSALKELELTNSLGLAYYYMGYYIHSCPKMRYKGQYQPSELLCSTTLQWFPLDQCQSYLEKHRFSPFDPVLAKERSSLSDDEADLSIYRPRFELVQQSQPQSSSEEDFQLIPLFVEGRRIRGQQPELQQITLSQLAIYGFDAPVREQLYELSQHMGWDNLRQFGILLQ